MSNLARIWDRGSETFLKLWEETVWTDLQPGPNNVILINPCKYKSHVTLTYCPAYIQSYLGFGAGVEKRESSGLLPSWRWIIKKSKLLSWLFRFIVQLLRRCEVFLPDVHVAIYPPSLSPKQHTSNRHASCCHWEQAYKANHVLSRNTVQRHTAFVVIPLFYHFPPPNNIQQNELIVIGVWGRV